MQQFTHLHLQDFKMYSLKKFIIYNNTLPSPFLITKEVNFYSIYFVQLKERQHTSGQKSRIWNLELKSLGNLLTTLSFHVYNGDNK